MGEQSQRIVEKRQKLQIKDAIFSGFYHISLSFWLNVKMLVFHATST